MFKGKGTADIMQRLRVPNYQNAFWQQIVIESIDNFSLHFIIKINNNISAKHNLGFFNSL